MKQPQKIPVKEFVKDVTEQNFDNLQLMVKYGLQPYQMVYVLGKLADRQTISLNRMFSIIEDHLAEENFSQAELCLKVIRKYFNRRWMVKVLAERMEKTLMEKKAHAKLHPENPQNSRKLEWFKSSYPQINIHPEIERIIKTVEQDFETSPSPGGGGGTVIDLTARLSHLAKYHHCFSGLSLPEANRMWHGLMLNLLAERGVREYRIAAVMDQKTCDICMHVEGARFDVEEASIRMNSRKNILPDPPFPMLALIENIPRPDKEQILMKHGWYLPPFCPDCRCQVSIINEG